jgi:lipid-A-disaccharide synthase-like uncharacterized protein
VKWEPVAAMIALLLLGMWVVYGPQVRHQLRPGATTARFVIGAAKGEMEVLAKADGSRSFRFLPNKGAPSPVLSEPDLRRTLGDDAADQAIALSGNTLFRALNVTGWGSLTWVAIGFAGQILFFGRMLVQWIVSERKRQSHIPESFWWFSLLGGILLFTYFAWRQDPVGVLGQTSGVVIYARNIRLIHKHRRRTAREHLSGQPSGVQTAVETGDAGVNRR